MPAAKLTLVAGSGLVLLDDMTTSSSNSALVMDVDFESEGDGTLTVWAGKTVTSTKSDVTITAWDVEMDGSLTAGTLSISVHGAKTSQTIGIGASLSQNMEILDGELGRLTAEAGLTIGTAVTGEIQVKGVTDGSSDSVGTITLVAMKDGTAVAFLGTASAFNKGIVVQAMGGVVLSESVTTKNWPTLIYAGTGTLKTLSVKSLVSTNQLLTVTADDVDLQGDVVDSGTAAVHVGCATPSLVIGLGLTSQQFHMTAAEVQKIAATGECAQQACFERFTCESQLTFIVLLAGFSIGGSNCGYQYSPRQYCDAHTWNLVDIHHLGHKRRRASVFHVCRIILLAPCTCRRTMESLFKPM